MQLSGFDKYQTVVSQTLVRVSSTKNLCPPVWKLSSQKSFLVASIWFLRKISNITLVTDKSVLATSCEWKMDPSFLFNEISESLDYFQIHFVVPFDCFAQWAKNMNAARKSCTIGSCRENLSSWINNVSKLSLLSQPIPALRFSLYKIIRLVWLLPAIWDYLLKFLNYFIIILIA